MIVIADSGSTTTDWILCYSNGEHIDIQTKGLNPFIVSEDEIAETFKNTVQPKIEEKISVIYFYGAGCRGGASNQKVSKAINRYLPEVTIEVNSDLLGAARATLQNEEGLCGIMGTGSIAGVYSDDRISVKIPALGYILGDEGSGTWYGKRLLRDYLKNLMPEFVETAFKNKYKESIENILQSTYYAERPNTYLASFTKFLSANKGIKYCDDLIYEGISEFISKNVIPSNSENNYVRIGMVGSIAWSFKEELTHELQRAGFKSITIVKSPIHLLKTYHI